MKPVPVHPRDGLARETKDDVKFVTIILDHYNNLSKKSKNEDVTFIKQVPRDPCKRLQRLDKIDEKVHFIKEVASTKPKKLVQAKKKINKMKSINDQIRAANENTEYLMFGEFNFHPKEILNKKLIFDTTIIDDEIVIDRIIDAINEPFNDKYWIEHKPGINYFTLRLEDGR